MPTFLVDGNGNPILQESGGYIFTDSAPVTLQFVDETSINPLPAGVLVVLTDANANTIGSAYTQAGGTVALPITADGSYTATFYGAQSPADPVTFTLTLTNVVPISVPNYESPTRVAASYTALQMLKWPARKFSDTAMAPGGVAYPFAVANGAIDAALDALIQVTIGAERLQSATGAAIDSWEADFIKAGYWTRIPGEPDYSYITRILAWLGANFTTGPSICALVNLYLQVTYLYGGGASDTPPQVAWFDWQTNPTQMALLQATYPQDALAQNQAPFVIVFVFGSGSGLPSWFLNESYLNYASEPSFGGAYLAGSSLYPYTPSSGVVALVKRIKALGTQPFYFTNVNPA